MREFKTKLEPFGRGFANCDSENIDLKVACGIYQACKEIDITIDPDTGLVSAGISGVSGFEYGSGAYMSRGRTKQLIEKHPEDREDLEYIIAHVYPWVKHTYPRERFTQEMEQHIDESALWGGTWMGHANPDFDMIARLGTDAIRERIESFRKKNPGKDDFYDSLIMTLDAIDILSERFCNKAETMLAGELTDVQRRHVEKIRDTFRRATKQPAEDFAEAVIVFSLVFTLDGVDSPGSFDRYMYGYWEKTDPELRREYLENLWQLFHETRTWNLCISGSDENWNDLSNDLTYAILEVTEKYKFQTPNLTMRCHRNTPEKLIRAAYKAIATGCGMPTLYNDEAVCPALERQGIPPRDSHLYVMNGCNQIDIMGKSHMGLEDGEVCIAKAVEYVLHNGKSQRTGLKLGVETGDPREFKSFDEFYSAFFKQLDHMTDVSCEMSNVVQQLNKEYAANPLRSILIEGCMEKGVDYKAGGPLYGNGQILAEGVADAIDSLAAVKKYVFEDKKYTMAQLVDAINKDFDGYDEMYHTLKNSPLKFGNDIEYVDSIGKEVIDHFNSYLLTKPTVRGGYFGGGCSPFNRAASYGHGLGALPNGHKFREFLIADSIGATPGNDVNGPTALLNSCLNFDHTLPTSGFILNIKFDKQLFNTKAGEEAFISLYHSYFDRGGQQLSVTVVSADELKDAQVHPERHRDLIVRVGGYSDYFTSLSKQLQDNVIARTDNGA